jgi:hypothetical protein
MSQLQPEIKKAEKGSDSLPLVKGRPGHLDGANDALLEVLRVLLHDDNGLLESVLLVDLLLELTGDERVGVPARREGKDELLEFGRRSARRKFTRGPPWRELP